MWPNFIPEFSGGTEGNGWELVRMIGAPGQIQIGSSLTRNQKLEVYVVTGPWPSPKWVLNEVRVGASSFNFQYLLVSLRSSSSCLRPLPRLHLPSIVPPKTYLRKKFLWKMLLTLLAFLHCILCRIFVSFFALWNNSWLFIRSFQLIFSILL